MDRISSKYYEAIKEINNNFNGSVSGNEEDKLVIDWNGIEEISVSDIQAKITEMETAKADEETAAANKKASGKQKLKDLGLDDDEIKALIGA
jgi:hypothetical protein|nr:hypothetical protein [uncultured Mediterranean phage uvMED]